MTAGDMLDDAAERFIINVNDDSNSGISDDADECAMSGIEETELYQF